MIYKKGRKSLLCIALFLFSSLYSSVSESVIAGNIRNAYRAREFGLVSAEEAKNVPRPGGNVLRANKSLQFYVSYLLWAIYQEGINIAVSNYVGEGTGFLPVGNIITPYSPVRSGFKVFGGKILYYDDWEAVVGYTWIYNPNGLSTRSFKIDNIYYSPWILQEHIDLAEIATNFSNQFNRIDSKLYRHLGISSSFTFTPWIGVLGAWEDQHLKADIEIQEDISNFSLFYMRNKQLWWCVGPYAGTEIAYSFWSPLSLCASYGGSLTLAKHSIYLNQETAELANPDERVVVQNLQEFYWCTEPMLEASLGLVIDVKLKETAWFFKAFWELQTWFDHGGIINPSYSTGVTGNYSMQGLTATIGVIF